MRWIPRFRSTKRLRVECLSRRRRAPRRRSAEPERGARAQIAIGSPFEDICTVAWPTAPSLSSQGTQIRTTCRGVDTGEYQFVDILVPDTDLEVTSSNPTVRIRGEVADVIESGMGFTTLAVIAAEADIL